jgi:uncharacterized protein YndB with AHSA1/START domain
MEKVIQHQLFYPHPPQAVWEYLTDAELMAHWLMKSDFLPIVGHEFKFMAGPPMPEMNFDGIFHCKVLEIVPLKKLVYSWQFGPGTGKVTNSVVTWTLTEKDNGTELLLIHDGFKGAAFMKMLEAMNEGWLKNINKILTRLNNITNGSTQA